jgi:ribosomal protein S18 acetylase RimI-like enzyme
MIAIRRMTPDDFAFAVSLTDEESWAYVEEDFERLLSYEPEGCFVAESGKQPVGIVTTTSYIHLGYIGNVIVDERFRGRDIGIRLVENSLRYLTGIGVKTVHLTSYMDTVGFYEKLGFKPEFLISSMSIETKEFDFLDHQVWKEGDVDRILQLDRRYFGGDRSRIIRRMMVDFPDLLLTSKGTSFGYIATSCTEKSCEIGPLIAESGDLDAAEGLLRGVLGVVSADLARIFVPHSNESATELVKSLGFREDFRTMRMFHGQPNTIERSEGIFAIGALEKG